jgi:hypothetical protein
MPCWLSGANMRTAWGCRKRLRRYPYPEHTPQSKVLEFLVAHLAGLEYLKDLSHSAHPLDKDQAVARAWGQSNWADSSGVSRTLQRLTEAEVAQYAAILEQATQVLLDQEVQRALAQGVIELDGDLTPRRVSNGSQTYPGAEYGYMSGRLQLGFQVSVISMRSPTYGRLELSARQHAGKTVSVTQAEGLALEAERRLGRRPLRRTDLLVQRLEQMEPEMVRRQQKVVEAQQNLLAAEAAQAEVQQLVQQTAQELAEVQATYQQNQRPERPTSHLAKVRQQAGVYQQRWERRRQAVLKAQAWLGQQQTRLEEWADQKAVLSARWQRFQAENACNPSPIQAILRLDAGFGDAGNLALLIEMGYEVYSKPYGTWLSGTLAKMSAAHTQEWHKVGQNAKMLAWKAVQLEDFPYPLDLGYERFWQSPAASPPQLAYSGLLHFGQKEVCADLPAWFHRYNARQTIEAGNKEVQQVFEVHHIKVRSRPAMRLQEHFALFAANFVRFAAEWLAEQCPQVPTGWQVNQSPKVKEQVKVGAHSPAQIEWLGSDCLVRFTERSVYVGRSFLVRRRVAIQLTLQI